MIAELDLLEYRKQLDTVDEIIIAQLNKRMEISKKIGAFKLSHSIPVKDNSREKIILDKVAAFSEAEYSEHIINVYQAILTESRRIQSK